MNEHGPQMYTSPTARAPIPLTYLLKITVARAHPICPLTRRRRRPVRWNENGADYKASTQVNVRFQADSVGVYWWYWSLDANSVAVIRAHW